MNVQKIKEACEHELKITRKQFVGMNWEDPKIYANWLAQTYYYAVYTTRIIAYAGVSFPIERSELHYKFLEHSREEKNHEKILLNDMKALGYSLTDFKPSLHSELLYQTPYYWIQHVNPISVYGYFLYLEGLAITFGPEICERVEKCHPEKAIRLLKIHVEEDKGHIEGHYDFLKHATKEELVAIERNMKQTGLLYRGLIADISQAKAENKKAA